MLAAAALYRSGSGGGSLQSLRSVHLTLSPHLLGKRQPQQLLKQQLFCSGFYWKAPVISVSSQNAVSSRQRRFVSLLAAKVEQQQQQQNSRWSWFRKGSRIHRFGMFLRYTRIPILVLSVYSIGYQQGVIDCTRRPVALQEEITKNILMSTGITNPKQIEVVTEQEIRFGSRKVVHQVAAVGHKIICVAREFVQVQLQTAMNAVREQLPEDVSEQEFLAVCQLDEQVQFWHGARLRLQGENVKSAPWQFIFIESPVPNAFVTEILPQRFFITTAMLKVATTPDELAVVLGHETSHLILGHISETNQVETMLRTVEILLLTLDPTEGVLSVMVVGALAAVHKALAAAHSREHEREADELGIILAARACFDTVSGSHVLYKMHELSVAPTAQETGRALAPRMTLLDTHPPSLERWERMKILSQTENSTKYLSQCGTISSRFMNALWGSTTKK